jgi:elongation factor G
MSREDLEKNFARAVVKGTLVPLFTVCSPKLKGLQKLCSFITQDLPSPAEFGARNAAEPGSDSYGLLVEPDESGPLAAKVFKTVVDPYVGRMSYLRCMRGTLKAESSFFNVRTGKTEKLGGLLGIKGAETANVDHVAAGDIFVVSKLESLNLWDTVTSEGHAICFPPVEYPEPTYSLAVTPKARGDEQKINEGLEKLAAETSTFKVARATETGELIVSGLSPLHLDVQLARLLRRFGVDTERALPKIPFRETITTTAEGHHRHKKQTGGRGQFAEVYLQVAARQRGEGFEFIDKVVGGAVPRNFIPEVEKGIRKFLAAGALAGFPVVDCSAKLHDGKFHQVDSDQLSFQLAGERGFLDGFNKAKPILLEPIMDVEIQVPERFTGDVAGNLSSMRGRMQGMEVVNGIQIIKAQVPLKEMQDYSTQLRSVTAGEGTFTMSMSRYEPVPGNLQAEIIKAHKKATGTDK